LNGPTGATVGETSLQNTAAGIAFDGAHIWVAQSAGGLVTEL